MQQDGNDRIIRKTFPQLPGSVVKNPTFIQTAQGNKLLTSGWWAYARKPVRRIIVTYPRMVHLLITDCAYVELHRRFHPSHDLEHVSILQY